MEREELIIYLDTEISRKEKECKRMLKESAGGLLKANDELNATMENFDTFVNIDLYNLQNALALDNETVEKMEAYMFFMSTKYYKLNEMQKRTIREKFEEYLNILKQDLEKMKSMHPEVQRIESYIACLKECEEIILREHFWLDDYMEIMRKLAPFDAEAKNVLLCLARYMNTLQLKNNDVKRSRV